MKKDNRGITVVIVALFLTGILAVIAFLIDVTAALIRRQELLTMVELGSAAGGRVVAEVIAELANKRVQEGEIPAPSEAEAKHPEKFISPEQREFIQTDEAITVAVGVAVREYVAKNKPDTLQQFDVDRDVNVIFPDELNDCSDVNKKSAIVKTNINFSHPFIVGRLATLLGSKEQAELEVEGRYNVKICP